MERRDLLKSIGLIGSSSLLPAVLAEFLSSCSGKDMSAYSPVFFSKKEYNQVTALIDILIPATGTKSASQVNVQVFLDQVFQQCLVKEEQQEIHEGLKSIETAFDTSDDKLSFVKELDEKAFGKKEANAWFRSVKKYTLIGFFTSEEGVTKASNYVKAPEAYKGDIPADENTLNYGRTTLHF